MLAAMTASRRLLLVHAHPDDESSQTGATMAKYVAEGAVVTLVTCTLGEAGEIRPPDLQHLTPEQLGAHRLSELAAAMAALGVTDFVRLGGDFAYRDSGMESDDHGYARPGDSLHEDCFWRADLLEAANHLVAIIRDRRPQVLITYDTFGGYGHPDHIQAHRVAMYASALAAVPSHRPDLGSPWSVSRILWGTFDGESLRAGLRQARAAGMADLFGGMDPDGPLPPMASERRDVAVLIPNRPWRSQAVAALAAHRSQIDMADPFWQFMAGDSANQFDAYRFGGGVGFPASGEPVDDVFAGL